MDVLLTLPSFFYLFNLLHIVRSHLNNLVAIAQPTDIYYCVTDLGHHLSTREESAITVQYRCGDSNSQCRPEGVCVSQLAVCSFHGVCPSELDWRHVSTVYVCVFIFFNVF